MHYCGRIRRPRGLLRPHQAAGSFMDSSRSCGAVVVGVVAVQELGRRLRCRGSVLTLVATDPFFFGLGLLGDLALTFGECVLMFGDDSLLLLQWNSNRTVQRAVQLV